MTQEVEWNRKLRDDLRTTLRSFILGQLRLMKNDREAIFSLCREVYIEDGCPEDEWEDFLKFAEDELDRGEVQLAVEMSLWKPETDCDRLDRVERALRERGILLWQVSPCCDTCTRSELPDRINMIDDRHPGFLARTRGYAFFIDQNLPEMLAECTELTIYLGYGWFPAEDSEVPDDVYQAKALSIAREVCKCLAEEGFEVDWNGRLDRKIGFSLNWQRRELLG